MSVVPAAAGLTGRRRLRAAKNQHPPFGTILVLQVEVADADGRKWRDATVEDLSVQSAGAFTAVGTGCYAYACGVTGWTGRTSL